MEWQTKYNKTGVKFKEKKYPGAVFEARKQS